MVGGSNPSGPTIYPQAAYVCSHREHFFCKRGLARVFFRTRLFFMPRKMQGRTSGYVLHFFSRVSKKTAPMMSAHPPQPTGSMLPTTADCTWVMHLRLRARKM